MAGQRIDSDFVVSTETECLTVVDGDEPDPVRIHEVLTALLGPNS